MTNGARSDAEKYDFAPAQFCGDYTLQYFIVEARSNAGVSQHPCSCHYEHVDMC